MVVIEGWATYVEYKAYFFSPNFSSPAEKLYLELISLQNKKSLLVQALLEYMFIIMTVEKNKWVDMLKNF